MADDTPLLTTLDFSADQLEEMARIAQQSNKAPGDWLRELTLDAMSYISQQEEPRDAEPSEPDEEQPQPEPAPVVTIDPAAENALGMLGELRALARENRVWLKTLLSELYAHTEFKDGRHELQARKKAIEKFARVERAVLAELNLTGGTAH